MDDAPELPFAPPQRRSVGRPTEYTPELGERICDLVRAIGFEKTAAELVHIHRHTVRHWRERGERGEAPFEDFALHLAQAKAEFVRRQLSSVEDPKWMLERLDREQFAATSRHELSGRDGQPIELAPPVLSKAAARGLIDGLLGVDEKDA